jgi:hypothetical protein
MEHLFAYNEKAELLKAKELRQYENNWVALVHEKDAASGETIKRDGRGCRESRLQR